MNTPILILSGTRRHRPKVRGLGFGADDYMTKPFHKDELIARIHAIVRRSKGHASRSSRTGKLTVNLDAKTVEVDGQRVHLTGKEYQMLELLSLRKGTTLTKEMFLNHLYGGMDEPELKIIDVFICKLRKKLAAATGGEHYIETVWGRGYVLRDPQEGQGGLDHAIGPGGLTKGAVGNDGAVSSFEDGSGWFPVLASGFAMRVAFTLTPRALSCGAKVVVTPTTNSAAPSSRKPSSGSN